LIGDDVAVADVDGAGDVDSTTAGESVDAATAAEILRGGHSGNSDVAHRGAKDAHEESGIDVLHLDLHRVGVAVDGGLRGCHGDVASAILKAVELGVIFGGDDGLAGAETGTEFGGAGECGAVGGGLQEAALVAQVAEVDRHTRGAEKDDEAEGGKDEAVAGFPIAFFGRGEISHCDISKPNDMADAVAGSALGRLALRKAERWRLEETSTVIGEQRKGQVEASEWGCVSLNVAELVGRV